MERKDPPNINFGRTGRHPHAEWVAAMKADPGNWYMLFDFTDESNAPQKAGNMARNIRMGTYLAYKPAGSFEARSVQGQTYARYVGDDTDE